MPTLRPVTLIAGFRAAVLESDGNAVVVHTGFCGCGAFGGHRVLMAMLQLVAAEKIAALARKGASSKEIGLAIGVASATVAKHPAYKGNVVWYRKCRTVGYSGRASWAEQVLDGQGRE